MNRWISRLLLMSVLLAAITWRTPAPLTYRPGEGWSYEPVGGGGWRKTRAKDQLQVATNAFELKEYRTALKAARRVVKVWPLSDYAPDAQYLVGRCYEARRKDEKAFKEYQLLVEKYPKSKFYDEVQKRQFGIANRYLGGQWFRLWGVVPFYRSMDKTSDMYEKIVKHGPFSEIAPSAQMSVGTAREKQKDYPLAVKAYERAADRYHDRKQVAPDAIYKAAKAYQKQAQTAEYDQSVSSSAINTYNDFIALYPEDPRVKEAQTNIIHLRTEQARGAYQIAKFYEKKKKPEGALVYYNEVLIKDPASKFAQEAKQRIEVLRPKVAARRAKIESDDKKAVVVPPAAKPDGEKSDKPAK